ncbi:MAG: hypothetical protein KA538_08230 [Azonexus sp.]|jgi:hypothetical protein|nr:hypothetical protein [Azonexus sp.]
MDSRSYEPLLGLLIVVPVVAAVAWVFMKGRKCIADWSERDRRQILDSLGAVSEPTRGYVHVVVPSYVGLLFTCSEYRTDVWVPQPEGSRAVSQLLFLSLKYGLVTIWAPWVLLNLLLNYVLAQPKLKSPSI